MNNQSMYHPSEMSLVLPKLEQLDHVVAIGGGHGLGRVLSSLNHLGDRLTGIVTTTDNGGSTGRLRETKDCIAWGDLRKCMHQLVTQPTLISLLLEYRFKDAGELSQHNFGNLMLLAMDDIVDRPLGVIQLLLKLIHVQSHIIPMSEIPTHLVAITDDQKYIEGEVAVDELDQMPNALTLKPQVTATQEAITAIKQAQLIIIGPGSFLTSIMPPLLMPDLRHAIASSDAKIMYITNLVPENSPAGKLSEQELLQWAQKMTDFTAPDAILSHNPTNKNCEPFYFRDIAQNTTRCHDRAKLRKAINELTELLFSPEAII